MSLLTASRRWGANAGGIANSSGSSPATLSTDFTTAAKDEATLRFRSPLQKLGINNASHTKTQPNNSNKLNTPKKTHLVDKKLQNKMTLIIDDVGARMKSSEFFDIVCKPAANLFMVTSLFRDNKISLDNAHIAIHVGTNAIHQFRRHRVITEVLNLVQQVRKVTTAWIYVSSLVPRPVDHSETAYTIRDYNHALKKAVLVAQNSGITGVLYVSNQQLYIDENNQLKMEFFHKRQIALSKVGAKCLMDNLILKMQLC